MRGSWAASGLPGDAAEVAPAAVRRAGRDAAADPQEPAAAEAGDPEEEAHVAAWRRCARRVSRNSASCCSSVWFRCLSATFCEESVSSPDPQLGQRLPALDGVPSGAFFRHSSVASSADRTRLRGTAAPADPPQAPGARPPEASALGNAVVASSCPDLLCCMGEWSAAVCGARGRGRCAPCGAQGGERAPCGAQGVELPAHIGSSYILRQHTPMIKYCTPFKREDRVKTERGVPKCFG